MNQEIQSDLNLTMSQLENKYGDDWRKAFLHVAYNFRYPYKGDPKVLEIYLRKCYDFEDNPK